MQPSASRLTETGPVQQWASRQLTPPPLIFGNNQSARCHATQCEQGQIVPVVKPRKPSRTRSKAEAFEGTLGDILFVDLPPRHRAEPLAGQINQLAVSALPPPLGRFIVAVPKFCRANT